jgi:serine/threonine-protein kinase RsbT
VGPKHQPVAVASLEPPLPGDVSIPIPPIAPIPPGDVSFPIRGAGDIVAARAEARRLAAQLGFGPPDQTLLTTAVGELAKNIVEYARQGAIRLRLFSDAGGEGIAVLAEDEGPGIADVGLALQDGFSTSGARGLGLPGVRRLMDDFEIFSRPGGGTRVEATKRARR